MTALSLVAREERRWGEGREEVGRFPRAAQLLLFTPHLGAHDFCVQEPFLCSLEALRALRVSLSVVDASTAAEAAQQRQTGGWAAQLKASSTVRSVRRCRWDDAECWQSVVAALSPAQLTAAELTVGALALPAGDGLASAEDLRWLAALRSVAQPPSAAAAVQADWSCRVLLCPATRLPSSPSLVRVSG